LNFLFFYFIFKTRTSVASFFLNKSIIAAHTQPLSLSLVTPPSQPSSSAAALATACIDNVICVCDTCASSHHSGDDSARTVVFDADNSNGRNYRPPNALNAYIDRKRTWSASF